MKLTLAEPKYLKDSISIISDLVNEARFKIKPEGVELVAMDPANVAMVIFNLLSSAFTEYDVKEEVQLGINLNNLKQILRRVNPNDMLILQLTDENMLQIQMRGPTVRTFSLPIIELEDKEQRIPELSFPVSVSTTATVLNNVIEDVDIIAESVTFMIEPKKFTILAEGDLNKAKIEVKESDETKIKSAKDKIKAKYSVEYLKKMVGGSKLADNVTVYFDRDYPLKLDYTTINKVNLVFILAPRVEND